MKGQNIIDYIISLSVFFSAMLFVIFFTISSLSGLIELYSLNLGITRAITVSQQLIYYNGSSKLNEAFGFGTGRYNEVNLINLNEFFTNCRRNQNLVKNIFLASDFLIRLDGIECSTRKDIQTIKRLLVVNRSIIVLEIGIRI